MKDNFSNLKNMNLAEMKRILKRKEHKIQEKILYALWIVACFVVTLLGTIYYKRDALLFHPQHLEIWETPEDMPEGNRNPGEHGLDYEDVQIVTYDNIKLHAWYI